MILNGLKGFINPVLSLWTDGSTLLGVIALLPSSYSQQLSVRGSGACTADQMQVNRPDFVQYPLTGFGHQALGRRLSHGIMAAGTISLP